MDLFAQGGDGLVNLLPEGGEVYYWGRVMDKGVADGYLRGLLEGIAWQHDEAVMFGRHLVTARKVAWYGDKEYSYTYSRRTKFALPWTAALLELKGMAEGLTGAVYNSCLLNLYHNGSEGMAWHSDDERALARDGSIASFSFGAERRFAFRHKEDKRVVGLVLEHGSLLEMKGATQRNWLHRLPPTAVVKSARVNLTFRRMVD